MKPRVIVISAAIVAAAVAALFWLSSRHSGQTQSLPPTRREETFRQMLSASQNGVYLEDQAADARAVTVGYAVASQAGYVEIRADDHGVPGAAIGRSGSLPTGRTEHFSVALSEPLLDKAVYYALLLNTDGTGVTDADGNVVLMSFAAHAGATPEDGPVDP